MGGNGMSSNAESVLGIHCNKVGLNAKGVLGMGCNVTGSNRSGLFGAAPAAPCSKAKPSETSAGLTNGQSKGDKLGDKVTGERSLLLLEGGSDVAPDIGGSVAPHVRGDTLCHGVRHDRIGEQQGQNVVPLHGRAPFGGPQLNQPSSVQTFAGAERHHTLLGRKLGLPKCCLATRHWSLIRHFPITLN